MLGDFLFFIAGTAINIFALLISALSVSVPTEINTAFAFVFSYVNLFSGIFPVGDLMLALSFLLVVWVAIYAIKIFLWLLSFIPWFNQRSLPGEAVDKSIAQHRNFVRVMKGRGVHTQTR